MRIGCLKPICWKESLRFRCVITWLLEQRYLQWLDLCDSVFFSSHFAWFDCHLCVLRLRIYTRNSILYQRKRFLFYLLAHFGFAWVSDWLTDWLYLVTSRIVTIWLKLNLTINLRYHAQYLKKLNNNLVQLCTHNLSRVPECMVHISMLLMCVIRVNIYILNVLLLLFSLPFLWYIRMAFFLSSWYMLTTHLPFSFSYSWLYSNFSLCTVYFRCAFLCGVICML